MHGATKMVVVSYIHEDEDDMRKFMTSYTWRLALTSNAMSRRERARGGAGAREGGRSAWLEKASPVLKTISPPGLKSLPNTNSDWLLKLHTPYNQVEEVIHKRNSQAQWRAQLKRPTTKKQTSRHQRPNKEKAKTHINDDAVHSHLQENHRRFNGINAPVNVRPCSMRLVTKGSRNNGYGRADSLHSHWYENTIP